MTCFIKHFRFIYRHDNNMADSVTVESAVNATLNETATNGTAKIPATIEGMSIAYLSLFFMAIFPIFVGSFRSVKHHQEQKVTSNFQLNFFFLHFTVVAHNRFNDYYDRITSKLNLISLF